MVEHLWPITIEDNRGRQIGRERTLKKLAVATIPKDLIKNTVVERGIGRVKAIVPM
jgi:hypothetical protein